MTEVDLSKSKDQRENESHDYDPNPIIREESGNRIFNFQQIYFSGGGFVNLDGHQNQIG